jgi:hypothetical protein
MGGHYGAIAPVVSSDQARSRVVNCSLCGDGFLFNSDSTACHPIAYHRLMVRHPSKSYAGSMDDG